MISFRNFAEPVTLVRSPTFTKGISFVSVNGSSPDSFMNAERVAGLRGSYFATASAIAAICSGVEPQQPPTTLTRPSRANSSTWRRHELRRLVILAEGVGQAGIRIGADQRFGGRR